MVVYRTCARPSVKLIKANPTYSGSRRRVSLVPSPSVESENPGSGFFIIIGPWRYLGESKLTLLRIAMV